LVGADSASDYPPEAVALPRVGGSAGLDLERIVALRPDLVLGWRSGNKPSDIARLEQFGLRVFLNEPRHVGDISRTLRALGILLGTQQIADERASAFEQRLHALQRKAAELRSVSVFFEVWHQPLITVNREHLISDLVALCAGSNVLGALAQLAPTVSLESVLLADPEVIIAAGLPAGALGAWQRFPRLRAVRAQQLYELDPDLTMRATPRLLDGAEQLCRRLEQARGSG